MEKMKILFPVDLSTVSPKIVPKVLEMGYKFGAEIHLLYVSGTLEEYSTFHVPHPSLDGFEDDIYRIAERKLQEFQEEHFARYPDVTRSVVRGHPAEEILKYIDAKGIDLVVVGTHGRTGLERMIFGSTAEHVIKASSVPVLSVNPYKRSYVETFTREELHEKAA